MFIDVLGEKRTRSIDGGASTEELAQQLRSMFERQAEADGLAAAQLTAVAELHQTGPAAPSPTAPDCSDGCSSMGFDRIDAPWSAPDDSHCLIGFGAEDHVELKGLIGFVAKGCV